MCGIVGYIGKRCALPVLLNGLRALEYRGYDSAGVTLVDGRLKTIRAQGKLEKLMAKLSSHDGEERVGIAHTRWATHGAPTELNAHPHRDCSGRVAIVHNGIIENYQELKEALVSTGHTFHSETDTEVLAHLIENFLEQGMNGLEALQESLRLVTGTYGLAMVNMAEPDKLYVAAMGSPIVIGVGEDEYIIASDASAIVEHTKDVIYLDEGEIAQMTENQIHIETISREPVLPSIKQLEWDFVSSTKNGHPHFMLKEILEQPEVVKNALRGRLSRSEGSAVLGGLEVVKDRLQQIDRIIIVGCGSAYYAGLVGEYLIEQLAGIPVEVELASEFRYRKPLISERTAVLAISQSGETADTLEAIREAKRKKALTLGIVNVVGSSIARDTDAGIYNHAGPEIGVASTKAFVSQLTVLLLFALYLGRARSMSKERGQEIIKLLESLPQLIEKIIEGREQINLVARKYAGIENCLYLGRQLMAPIAYEGALKLKEVSYIHAEGYSSGEMKHGPLALIHKSFPSIVLCPRDRVYEKTRSNIEELRARSGPIISITTEGNTDAEHFSDSIITIPDADEILLPILAVIPTQLLAYFISTAKGLDPDRPRNLAKSVTVE